MGPWGPEVCALNDNSTAYACTAILLKLRSTSSPGICFPHHLTTKTLRIKTPTLGSPAQSVTHHTWHLLGATPGLPRRSFISSLETSTLSELTVTYETRGPSVSLGPYFNLGSFPVAALLFLSSCQPLCSAKRYRVLVMRPKDGRSTQDSSNEPIFEWSPENNSG